MSARLAVVCLAVATLAACGGESASFSIEEAQEAFAEQGYTLVDPPPDPAGFAPNPWQTGEPKAFVPEGGPAFFVFVGEVEDPEELWAQHDSDHGPATFDARKGNVIVVSDAALAASDRDGVLAALEALPGGGDVVVAEP